MTSPPSCNAHVSRWLPRRYADAYASHVAYQRSLPFATVAHVPPHTLRGVLVREATRALSHWSPLLCVLLCVYPPWVLWQQTHAYTTDALSSSTTLSLSVWWQAMLLAGVLSALALYSCYGSSHTAGRSQARWTTCVFHTAMFVLWHARTTTLVLCAAEAAMLYSMVGARLEETLLAFVYPQWLSDHVPLRLAYVWLTVAAWYGNVLHKHNNSNDSNSSNSSTLLRCHVLALQCTTVVVHATLMLHAALVAADLWQREVWRRYRAALTHATTPHVRAVTYAASADYPLSRWHLRCEDGRQRWCYASDDGDMCGDDGDDGGDNGMPCNAMARAQVHGYDTVAAYMHARASGSVGDRARATAAATAARARHREWLEDYQLGRVPLAPPMLTTPLSAAHNNDDGDEGEGSRKRVASLAATALRAGVRFLLRLQDPFSGHWPNDYSGCLFLTPGLVFVEFIVARGDTTRMFALCEHGEHAQEGKSKTGNNNNNDNNNNNNDKKQSAPRRCACAAATRHELVRYMRNHQNADGGWGQHTEGHSTMLGTTLNYTAMRLLGVGADDAQATRARAWLRARGGAVSTPMWGKMWLCVLGLYDYRGLEPLPPEMALLPQWLPCSFGRLWCHSRVIAVAFSHLYGLRWSAMTAQRPPCRSSCASSSSPCLLPEAMALLQTLRDELYVTPYACIDWPAWRSRAHAADVYTPPSCVYHGLARVLRVYERWHVRALRRRALDATWRHIAYDDENTHFICLGPVNKATDMLVTWLREGDDGARYRHHRRRVADYLYLNTTGMTMNGYNGSQLWDTAFAVQALCACGDDVLALPPTMTPSPHAGVTHDGNNKENNVDNKYKDTYAKDKDNIAHYNNDNSRNDAAVVATVREHLALAQHYVGVAQVRDDPIDGDAFWRHRTRGAWNFSTRAQSWQVSDCTAEGLRAALLLAQSPYDLPLLPRQRLYDAVDELLSLRNTDGDGGWCSYEARRAPPYVELLCSAELFKDVMTEYTYVECTSSCVHTLALFRRQHPDYRRGDVDDAIAGGVRSVLARQQRDGGFYGSWAVCFTYAAWLVASALHISGEVGNCAHSPHCRRLIDYLLAHQRDDDGDGDGGGGGGWGESINACVRGVYVDSDDGRSQVVHTAWAVMAIMHAAGDDGRDVDTHTRRAVRRAVDRGVALLLSRQRADGDWPQERICGVFNGNNPIHYPGYKNVMPVWALAMYKTWSQTY